MSTVTIYIERDGLDAEVEVTLDAHGIRSATADGEDVDLTPAEEQDALERDAERREEQRWECYLENTR